MVKNNSSNFGNEVLKRAFSMLLQKSITKFDDTLNYRLYINIDDPAYMEDTRNIDLNALKTSPKNSANGIQRENVYNMKIDFSESYYFIHNKYYTPDYFD